MKDNIKGLEKDIQTYIKNHTDSTVSIEIFREVDFFENKKTQTGMIWKIKVSHEAIELP